MLQLNQERKRGVHRRAAPHATGHVPPHRRENQNAARMRYEAVRPREQPERNGGLVLAKALLTAPVLGSRLIFPRRFDAAVARLVDRRSPADVSLPQALWYFGPALRLWIDPSSLQHRLSDFVEDAGDARWIGSYFLDGADWSAAVKPLRSSPTHREMTELVEAGLDFREVRRYRRLQRVIEGGRPKQRSGALISTVEELDGYFRYCVALARSLREHGVAPRSEARRLRLPFFERRHTWFRPLELTERDIGVAIDRDGRLIRHLGGKHRTALAQALGVARIPVEVRMVHVDWLARQIEHTGLPAHRALPAGIASLSAAGET